MMSLICIINTITIYYFYYYLNEYSDEGEQTLTACRMVAPANDLPRLNDFMTYVRTTRDTYPIRYTCDKNDTSTVG